ncbi:hypothetical protein GCM10018781_13400 [Kitasatospora indigofera]|uniref:Uncharacterized protein n=1 Tax=Kitasatospora indigofera TaxID=67307 RepID=A0A919FEU1_9ACTN|nr:hypothetical protein [Kitasatospora indigofera]GHH63594.1 hypothetical protein GCM10018781_13400 [Kitasatospora indigofera]
MRQGTTDAGAGRAAGRVLPGLTAGAGLAGGGAGLAGLAGAPWWVSAASLALAGAQIAAAAVVAVVQAVVPQSSGDRRRVWEALLAGGRRARHPGATGREDAGREDAGPTDDGPADEGTADEGTRGADPRPAGPVRAGTSHGSHHRSTTFALRRHPGTGADGPSPRSTRE